ncbi:hypothetical protein F2Q69_00043315 [Brassica cretica]|uniref:Uncharacterized protein n=2 Tax=Brassica TaxID=3705 RepID=A0A8S9NCN3_BRACR|nr:hypothetical protein F2Q69_00043315 [Brassica cretica]
MLSDLRQRLSPVKCAAREVLRLRRGRCFVDSRRGSSWWFRLRSVTWKGRLLGFGAGPFSVSRSASRLSLCRELRLVFFFVYGGSVLDDSSRRKRVLSGRVQAEMADLSVQTCVVSSEGCNQVVVHGSCGLLDANPSRPEFFVRAPSLVSLAIAEAFALDCLFGFMCLCPLCRHRSWDLAAWYRPFGSQRTHLASRFSGVINRLGVSLWSLLAVPRPRYFCLR